MLQRLTIENVALIDRAEIEFTEGLNVLSGETGAGKSVILDSIDFVLGAKADKSLVRYGTDACLVRAEFFVGGNENIRRALEALEIEAEDTIVVSRRFTVDGKSSIKLNGAPVTAAMLRSVTAELVDVHGQSEHFFLLKESNQLKLLDAVGGTAPQLGQVRTLVAERRRILGELKQLGGDEGERNRRLDILKFQIDEIERAALKEGEEEELAALRTRYRNAERILGGLNDVRGYLLSDGGCVDALGGSKRALLSVAKYDDRYAALADRLENLAEEAADVGAYAEQFAEELDIDEREAERAENRLDEIRTLEKKYGGSVAEVNAFCEKAREEYALLSDSGERCARLNEELAACDEKLYAACRALTEARKKTAEEFTVRVEKELATLNIGSARFEVQFDGYCRDDVAKATSEGLDKLRFLFSANAGEPAKELGKIISGGEMSRFMLAVKSQLSAFSGIGTYLFDEIDAGIGGKTARVVAEKFSAIAKRTQVIAVSHLAQIAAFADRQFLIEKREEGERTFTRIRLLDEAGRLKEIARLTGGDAESEIAGKHAKELLDGAEAYKNSLR